MKFDLENKVALVTGGAAGIGLDLSKALLRNHIKGVTLADFNEELALKTLDDLSKEFDKSRYIFIKTDVTNPKQFEEAFKKTINHFGSVDVLINNAGMFRDGIWDKQIDLNVTSTIRGCMLSLKNYLKNHKQGDEGLIVNIASVNAFEEDNHIPVYCGTKLAVVGLTKALGHEKIYQKTGVKIMAICPGPTVTPAVLTGEIENPMLTLGEMYLKLRRKNMEYQKTIRQRSDYVAQEVLKVIKQAENGSIWCIENNLPPYEYIFPDKSTMKKDTIDCYIK